MKVGYMDVNVQRVFARRPYIYNIYCVLIHVRVTVGKVALIVNGGMTKITVESVPMRRYQTGSCLSHSRDNKAHEE